MKSTEVLLITKPDFDVPAMIGGLAQLTQLKKEFEPVAHEAGLKIMRNLFRLGHTSLFECADFGFIFKSSSRVFLAQITRHRVASYTSGSQQYQDHDNFPYVVPESIAANPEAKQIYDRFMQEADLLYRSLKNLGISKDDARYVIPGAACNHLYAKFNLREIVGPLMTQRLCKRNTPETLRHMRGMIQALIDEGFKECVTMGGCGCVSWGACDQGRMHCSSGPYMSWEEMIYGDGAKLEKGSK